MTVDNIPSVVPGSGLSQYELNAWYEAVSAYTVVLPLLEADLQQLAGLSYFDFQVLCTLDQRGGPISMSIVADTCNSSLSRLSHVARKLEQRGLMTREMSSTDRRVTEAQLTEEGQEIINNTRPRFYDALKRRVFSSQEGRNLDSAREVFRAVLRNNSPHHWTLKAHEAAQEAERSV